VNEVFNTLANAKYIVCALTSGFGNGVRYDPEVDGDLPGPAHPGGRVTVNAVAPGYVATKMSDGLAAWGVTADNTAAKTPLGRMGSAADMAGAALYLASPAGAWTSGVVLPVDGGILATPLSLGDLEA